MSKKHFFNIFLKIVAVVVVIVSFSGILWAQDHDGNDAFEHVKAIHEKHTGHLLEITGVEGTAIGLDPNNQLSIKVFVVGPKVTGIPKELDGVKTDIVVTGKFRAAALKPQAGQKPPKPGGKIDPTSRFPRPVPIGVSTGNVGQCMAGTIGCRVKDSSGNVYALSNNHVYALSNTAAIGSDVSEPGILDSGCTDDPDNVIGTLADFQPLDSTGINTMDAAIALSSTDYLGNATPSNGYGKPKSVPVDAVLRQKVQKYGRTTSLTTGTVTGINAAVWITYDDGQILSGGQIIIQSSKPFVKAGDSGSLVVTNPGRQPVGLLYAGDASGKYAVANQIVPVLTRFGVTIDGE